jgi:hypothetical protein
MLRLIAASTAMLYSTTATAGAAPELVVQSSVANRLISFSPDDLPPDSVHLLCQSSAAV